MSEPVAKIISMRGGELPLPLTPMPTVIEALEWALDAARAGEIVGVAAVFMHSDGATSSQMQGNLEREALGLLEILKADLVDRLRGNK